MITRNNKRKNTFYDNKENLKRKKQIDWNKMISPSSIRNFLLKDPLLDWFKMYNIRSINDIPHRKINGLSRIKNNNESNFIKYIMDQGNLFEDNVFELLSSKFQVVKVAESFQARQEDKFLETVKHMENGIEIIYQGVLHDYKNNIYGCPDLLVRSDRMKDLFCNTNFNENNLSNEANKLNIPFHYVVIDIKHSTLYMASNNINLLNSNSIPAYKGQVYLYNKALGEIQGFEPDCGYILGKQWVCKNHYGTDFMDKLGIIDFKNYDSQYSNLVQNAINWIYKLRSEGHTWKLLPKPSVPELYPNMKNEKDGLYRKLKNDLNTIINEITSVWMCGYKKRQYAHTKNIYSWKDKNCTAKNLSFKKGKISNTVNSILKINRQNRKLIDFGTLIDSTDEWRYFGDDIMEFYIDFETINSNMGTCNLSNINYESNELIFMIGIGWFENNKYNYKCFTTIKRDYDSEYNMIKDFLNEVNIIKNRNNKSDSTFIHWTKAEPQNYNKLIKRHYSKNDIPRLQFYDLYKLFYDNCIVIKGSLNFSLKNIAKSMYNNKMIESNWNSKNPCSNGLNAMLYAFKLYEKLNVVTQNEPIMKDIIDYNNIDCKVLWEILYYLRNNL
jgi:hypothetical protein